MKLTQFALGLALSSIVVFAITFILSGSLWRATIDGVLYLLVVQIGYFCIVLYLVWRGKRARPGSMERQQAPYTTSEPERCLAPKSDKS